MDNKLKLIYCIFTVIISLLSFTISADERPLGVHQQIISVSTLENIPGHNLTSVIVELNPGVIVPTHTHSGFVYVYVLEGTVRSQLDQGKTVEFSVGQSWTEPPGMIHSITQNPSTTDKVKFLAVLVTKDGAELTHFEQTKGK